MYYTPDKIKKKSLSDGAEWIEDATSTQLGRAASPLKLFFIWWTEIISNFAYKVRFFNILCRIISNSHKVHPRCI